MAELLGSPHYIYKLLITKKVYSILGSFLAKANTDNIVMITLATDDVAMGIRKTPIQPKKMEVDKKI